MKCGSTAIIRIAKEYDDILQCDLELGHSGDHETTDLEFVIESENWKFKVSWTAK